jgi:hypothetical protein
MITKFTVIIGYLNYLMNKHEKGSDEYKLICRIKYKYIHDFK